MTRSFVPLLQFHVHRRGIEVQGRCEGEKLRACAVILICELRLGELQQLDALVVVAQCCCELFLTVQRIAFLFVRSSAQHTLYRAELFIFAQFLGRGEHSLIVFDLQQVQIEQTVRIGRDARGTAYLLEAPLGSAPDECLCGA